jgi:hypothetical protein
MRTTHRRTVAIAAVGLLTLAGSVSAQGTSGGLLNNLEVRQLVARAELADHARLAGHFAALADRYTAEAKRHISMSQSFAGNPSRNLGSGMSAHCKRLADLSTQSAAAVRELAAYHEKSANGAPAAPPRDGARFQGGAGAPPPTAKELGALAAKANTPAEHRAFEEYFLTLAKRYTGDANDHVTWAQTYRGTRIAQAAVHHDRLAGLARDAAKEATVAAEMHEGLAKLPR